MQEWDKAIGGPVGKEDCEVQHLAPVQLNGLCGSSNVVVFCERAGRVEDWVFNIFPKGMCLEQYVQVVPTEDVLLNAGMSKVMILRDFSWQILAAIEPFIPCFCVILLPHGSFWYPGRGLQVQKERCTFSSLSCFDFLCQDHLELPGERATQPLFFLCSCR